MQPVPVGVHGELYIGGDGLARGYLNRPELTEERFLRNPFSYLPDSRLYRTGDLARYRADGNIEFLGRVDNQVKIRGHRIELGEIETVLNQHPGVKDSVVVARERDSSSEKELVGYLVPTELATPSSTDLRNFLREKFPDYMVPSIFVPLDALPLTPNGKIDRYGLPAPDGTRPKIHQGYVAPRTEIEDLVAQVWREVLKLEAVGVYDNFFELGGHSLLATRVIARLRVSFNIDIALRKLFELPDIAGLAQHLEELIHNRSGTTTPPILPVDRDRAIFASFSQQRLWFLRELDPKSTAYSIPSVFLIRGPLNMTAMEEALNAVVARHEVLRTTFEFVEGSVVQKIRPHLRIFLPVTNLDVLTVDARDTKAREIALEEAHKPFDLRDGPLWRARLFRLDSEEHYLLLNADHTVLDGWSMGTLFKELGTLYGTFANNKQNPLPPLTVQYADYAAWQQHCLQGDGLESQVRYWQGQVSSSVPLSLPTDYARPIRQTSRGVRKTLPLSSQLTHSLKELSRREGVTVFMTLLAAFKILLSRHSEQEDVMVGSTIAGRNRPEIEELIGFFINALPLRTDLTGNPSFLELLKRVREVCLSAYMHQDLPFEKIVEAVNPDRDLSRNPLFQIMFNLADVTERALHLDGCEVTKESFFEPEAKFDITLYAPERDGIFELAIVYNADLFSDSRIAIMLEQFSHLLSQIVAKPSTKIGEYSLVLPSHRALLPDPTESLDDNWEGPIHACVANWADRAPDRVALVDANETWTYLELEILSRQLTNYLIVSGIQSRDVVAIYAERRSALVLVLLAILKAGATFVILDPAYPAARLTTYLKIARPKGWIQLETAEELPEDLSRQLETFELTCRVEIPADKRAIADLLDHQPETPVQVEVGARDPAYIAFTSGSTGEPKGVLCRHGPITHFLPWQKNAFDLREDDRFALLSGLAYNHLQRDVFTPLAMGASLYVPPSKIVREPEPLCEWLRANAITVLHLTPALGQLLLTGAAQGLPTVRRIFFGGDSLTRDEVAQIREVAPNATIGCFYGATETQRAVGYYEIPQDSVIDYDTNRPTPLGRGIRDVQLLLLNQTGQLAGIGELAELHIRSPHLAEGYIDDEARTKELFITNPFTHDPDDRLYRTGELGRYLPDGNVEWAGRNDRRVNIRGFRVELEEIEFALKQHPTVKDAAVVLQESDDPHAGNRKSDRQLVAYVIADEDRQTLADLLHGYLSTCLPDYMMPASFVILEKLPLTPNGKVDYQALPKVRDSASNRRVPIVPPRNDIEVKLCDIFAEVLGRTQIGIEENFFRIGGHSLLAAQVAARIREAFGVAFELRTFLESPTIAGLAKEIEVRIKAVDTTLIADDSDREEIEL
jgi:amino acid adenylation domain-containing protein